MVALVVPPNETSGSPAAIPVSVTVTVSIPSTSVTTTITDNDVATVSLVPTTDAAEAGLVNGEFTVTLSSPASTDTIVDYTLSGTAASGNDYSPLTSQVTILAGSTTATITIPTIDSSSRSKPTGSPAR